MSLSSFLAHSTLLGLCSSVTFSALAAQPYVHGAFGFGDENSSQIGGGFGVDFDDSPWGIEFNGYLSNDVDVNEYSAEQSWVAVSGLYRISDFLYDNVTLTGGLGVASVYQTVRGEQYSNNDYVINITPNFELSYEVNQYLDLFGGYRFFIGDSFDSFSTDVLTLGARLYWSRPEPEITLVSDKNVSPTMEILRSQTFEQASQLGNIIDGYGLTQNVNQFFVQNNAPGIEWQTLTITIDDDKTFDIPVNNYVGQLEQRLPKGKHQLNFTLSGKSLETGELHQTDTSYSILLYNEQGLNFVLSVEQYLLGEKLNVQAF